MIEAGEGVLGVLTAVTVFAGAVLAGLAGLVWRRRGSRAGLVLAVLLLAAAWWGVTYAGELTADETVARQRWGDLKYVGIGVLPAAWLVFVLDYTGRGRLVTSKLLTLLAMEPAVLWVLLAVPATHDLVRSYPAGAIGQEPPVVAAGPVFWVNWTYANAQLVIGTVLLMISARRLARTYRIQAGLVVTAALLPWAANVLHNFEVGVFRRLDLTPLAFVVTGAVLVYGLYRPRFGTLASVAWHRVVQSIGDGVLLVDAFDHVVDANPAAQRLLNRAHAEIVGRRVERLLPDLAPTGVDDQSGPAAWQVRTPRNGDGRYLDVERQPLLDTVGALEGALLLVRDVTERTEHQQQLERLLAERTRIATALQSSLLPARAPQVPRLELASRYLPAGSGQEIGGDFFDVFALDCQHWGVVLGDVSGKGAEAAAVTGMIRYTLRAYADAQTAPSDVLGRLNQAMLDATADERYCTLVYGVAEITDTELRLRLCLAGHHPPLLRRRNGHVNPVGRLGTALGLVSDPVLVDTDLVLRPGDLLCLYTDGLVEARRGDDWYGVHRAADVLATELAVTAAAAVKRLDESVQQFQRGPLADDLALLAIRFAPDMERRS